MRLRSGEWWFEASPGRKFVRSHLNRIKSGCDGSHLLSQQWQETENRRIIVHPNLGEKARFHLKITRAKRVRGVAQAVENLLNKHKGIRPWVQTPVLRKERERERERERAGRVSQVVECPKTPNTIRCWDAFLVMGGAEKIAIFPWLFSFAESLFHEIFKLFKIHQSPPLTEVWWYYSQGLWVRSFVFASCGSLLGLT
jgi:hypothetical protein